jgi:hypothetical protein
MDLVTYDDYDKITERVRQYCAQKYVSMIESLTPYINGDMGDITPGHAAAYINLVKELGRLYGAQKPPRDPEAMIPASKVAALLAATEARQEQAIEQAVADAEARLRAELETRNAGAVQHARTQVLQRLGQVHR